MSITILRRILFVQKRKLLLVLLLVLLLLLLLLLLLPLYRYSRYRMIDYYDYCISLLTIPTFSLSQYYS